MLCLHLLFVQAGVNLSLSNPTINPITTPVPSVTPNSTVTPPKNNTTATVKRVTPTPTPVARQEFKIYFFWQPNCPYCEEMRPILSAWATESCHAPRVGDVVMVNTWTDSATSARYAIHSTPTTVVTDLTGKELMRYVGVFDITDLDWWLDVH